jgi:hypothetical protein
MVLLTLQTLNVLSHRGEGMLSDAGVMLGLPRQIVERLSCLRISGSVIPSDAVVAHIAQHAIKVAHLDLIGCPHVTGVGLSSPTTRLHRSLTSLNLCGSGITDVACSEYVSRLTVLQELRLPGCCSITDNGISALLKALPWLTTLILCNCVDVTSASLCSLPIPFPLHASTTRMTLFVPVLRELDLSGCKDVCDVGIRHVAHSLERLEVLHLGHCSRVGDEGVKDLYKLRYLREVNLYGCCRMTDIGVQALARLEQLEELNLGACFLVTDTALCRLAAAPRVVENLRGLNLFQCSEISDMGLVWLSSCINMKVLSAAYCTRLTDNGLLALSTSLKRLRFLSLIGCSGLSDISIICQFDC